MSELKKELAFLCYASDDLELVWKIYYGLKKREVALWFDKKDMKEGKWMPQIKTTIARSKYFIQCLSKAAIKKYVKMKEFRTVSFYLPII